MIHGLSCIPIGIALCYCYLTLRESNKFDINTPWYQLNSLESMAIIYCVIIGTIRAHWGIFVLVVKVGVIGLLVLMGWSLLYNLEEFKDAVILIMRQNSLEGENIHETDFETEINLEKRENEPLDEESFTEKVNSFNLLGPQIDKFLGHISVDTRKIVKCLDEEPENDENESASEELVSQLEKITDTLVRDTKKIADNVSLVSSMMVENSATESSETVENSENLFDETKNDIVPLEMDKNNDYQNEIDQAAQLICNTENIAESMMTAIESFVDSIIQ